MMFTNRLKHTFVVCFAALCPTMLPAATETGPNMDGLELVEQDRHGAIYAAQDVEWTNYNKLMFDEVTVAFRKDWLRDQNRSRKSLSNRVSASDAERIRNDLATLFEEVFAEELSDNGTWPIVEESGEDVLLIKPSIVDLDVYAPDIQGASRTQSYTDSAGKMTLKLEFYDSATGALLAQASDRQESLKRGYVTWATKGSNKAEARIILQKWAKALNSRLSEVAGEPSEN
jgi:hypothetical protein